MESELSVVPTGEGYAIEKVEAGKLFALTRSPRGKPAEKVIISTPEAAEGVVSYLQADESSFFRNRPWYWDQLSGVTQGGAGVPSMKGASA